MVGCGKADGKGLILTNLILSAVSQPNNATLSSSSENRLYSKEIANEVVKSMEASKQILDSQTNARLNNIQNYYNQVIAQSQDLIKKQQ